MMRCHSLRVKHVILFWLLWATYSLAQDSTTCQELLTSFASCLVDTFDLQSDAAACDTCRLQYSAFINNSTEIISCDEVENIQCAAVKECPCNECNSSLESYLNCEVINNYNSNQCPSGIDCRTSTVNCENSFDEYRNCIYRLPVVTNGTTTTTGANGKACDECRLNVANQFLDGGTCDAAQSNFCTGVNNTCAIACGDCIDELDFFFTCDVLEKSNGNCQINCNTTSTPPTSDEPLCSDNLSEFALCVTQDLPSDADGIACDNCRINAETSFFTSVSTSDSCINIQQVSCNEAVPTCADICRTCTASLADYWICYLATKSFIDCSTAKCEVLLPSMPSPQAVSPTTSNPVTAPTINQPALVPISVPVGRTSMPSNAGPQRSPVRSPIVQPTGSDIPSSTSATFAISIFNGTKFIVPLIALYFVIS